MKRIKAGLYTLDGHTVERIGGTWFVTFAGQSKPDEWANTLREAKQSLTKWEANT